MSDILSNLVCHLPLNQSSGTTANDSSGLGNNVPLANSPSWVSGGKFSGNALQLNGTNQYGTIPDVFNYPTTGTASGWPLTVAFWMKTSTITGGVLMQTDGTGVSGSPVSYVPTIYCNNSHQMNCVLGYRNDVVTLQSNTHEDDGSWHHWAFVCDGSNNQYIYIDGVLDISRSGSGSVQSYSSSYAYFLGAIFGASVWGGSTAGWTYLQALLNEFRIYQRALSSTDVAALYAFTPSAGPTYSLSLASGSYGLTGENAALAAARKLALGSGVITLTGESAALKASRKLVAASGSYGLTGESAALKAARKLTAALGSYGLTGEATGLATHRKIAPARGMYALTGEPANLVYTPKNGGLLKRRRKFLLKG